MIVESAIKDQTTKVKDMRTHTTFIIDSERHNKFSCEEKARKFLSLAGCCWCLILSSSLLAGFVFAFYF